MRSVDLPTDSRTQDLGSKRMSVVMGSEKLSGIVYILIVLKFAAAAERTECRAIVWGRNQ
jgi:hypothetical protein